MLAASPGILSSVLWHFGVLNWFWLQHPSQAASGLEDLVAQVYSAGAMCAVLCPELFLFIEPDIQEESTTPPLSASFSTTMEADGTSGPCPPAFYVFLGCPAVLGFFQGWTCPPHVRMRLGLFMRENSNCLLIQPIWAPRG